MEKEIILKFLTEIKAGKYNAWAEVYLTDSRYDTTFDLIQEDILAIVKDFLNCRIIELEDK